jgi:integrase
MPAPLSVAEAADRYMRDYRGRDGSIHYRLEAFVARLGDKPLAEITDEDVLEVLRALETAPARRYVGRDVDGRPVHKVRGGRSGATLNRYKSTFSAMCSWAIKQRLVPKGWAHPCRGLPAWRESEGVVRFLDADERTRLLAAVRASSWPRLYVLVLMALTTGARRGELERLTWGDVDLARATAMVRETKNGRPKVLVLVPGVVEALKPFRRQDERRFAKVAERRVFHSERRPERVMEFTKHWRAALKAAGIKAFRFHDLRHSCASWLAQEGASLLEIADVLGHKQLRMTQRYSHLTVQSKAALISRVMGDLR